MSIQIIISRRSVLRAAGLGALGIAVRTRVAAAATTATAFALCGDESHNSDSIRTALTYTLVEGAGLSIDFTDQERLLTYDNLKNYKILIMFRDGLRFPNGYYQHMYWNWISTFCPFYDWKVLGRVASATRNVSKRWRPRTAG
jgi:hypothetical protein